MLEPAIEDETLPRNNESQTSMQTKSSLAGGYINCHQKRVTTQILTPNLKSLLIYGHCDKCGGFKIRPREEGW